MGMALSIPRYTVEGLEQFPDDGNRYELLDGVLLVTPQASRRHQVIATRLAVLLSHGMPKGVGEVVGPGAIVLPPLTELQPDLIVNPARFGLDAEWLEVTEHWLAVEIISRSSRIYDHEFKRDAYFALGVREVWLVDPWTMSIEVCRAPGAGVVESERVAWRVPEAGISVAVDVGALFAGLSVGGQRHG